MVKLNFGCGKRSEMEKYGNYWAEKPAVPGFTKKWKKTPLRALKCGDFAGMPAKSAFGAKMVKMEGSGEGDGETALNRRKCRILGDFGLNVPKSLHNGPRVPKRPQIGVLEQNAAKRARMDSNAQKWPQKP